jgi:PhnB protein
MEIAPYLNFNGDCGAAFKLYEKVLGGKIVTMQTHGDSPMKDQVPPDWHDRVIHVRLEAGGLALMGSDAPPEQYSKPQGLYVSVSVPDAAEAKRIFDGLSAQGTVTMPFESTFWSAGFGMLVDRFGTPWMVNTEQK